MAVTNHRLPANVKPQSYALSLTPDIQSFTFSGHEEISVMVLEPTERIILNAAEIGISKAQITLSNGTILSAGEVLMDEAEETVTLVFNQMLPVGSASLSLDFQGVLNDQLRGFYRSHYIDGNGDSRVLLTTQFEPTDARRAFPCWDEPGVKAKFVVTLRIPQELVAISNMPVDSEIVHSSGVKSVTFVETPTMSTYILAFVVGDMAYVESRTSGGTTMRVWAVKGKEHQGLFALENSIRLLEYFNSYFGAPYPLPKLDHIAIPDFAAGAMENWGAITYREVALLYDPEQSGASTRQRILQIVAHEMAHMWFGDLVTMKWWDDLWLNESFASWMGDKAVDQLYPEWEMWTQFVSHDTNAGLALDGLRNSHSIEAKVDNPAEVQQLFDAISYSKGAAVLRMLEEFLGPDIFQAGLQRYISEFQYKNAETNDLWGALAKSSGQPVAEIMDTWIKQIGYPVLYLESGPGTLGEDIRISQTRFLYDHLLGEESDPTLWQVPLTLLTNDGHSRTLFASRDISISVRSSPNWIKANPDQTGFYRVNYTDENWNKLELVLHSGQLSPTDRLGLQNDAYALMRAGIVPATRFLSLAGQYRAETNAMVWGDLSANIRSLDRLLTDMAWVTSYHHFAQGLFAEILREVGWDVKAGEGHLEALRRATVLANSGYFGDLEVVREASERFDKQLRGDGNLHPDLRGIVYGLVAQHGDHALYETMWGLEESAELHEEKLRLLLALCRFSDPALIAETLRLSLTDRVRSQDAVMLITAVSSSQQGRDLAWEFIQNNWTELDRRYGGGGFALMRLVAITGGFTDLSRADEVETFFKNHPAPAASRTVEQSLEQIRLNAKWLELNQDSVFTWLSEKG
ncbi:MAG: M1 family metallopeptidase [SAR202 cluster bacterium]|nr:M1 family metallopeptidase [SAR202 cluster bacterium]